MEHGTAHTHTRRHLNASSYKCSMLSCCCRRGTTKIHTRKEEKKNNSEFALIEMFRWQSDTCIYETVHLSLPPLPLSNTPTVRFIFVAENQRFRIRRNSIFSNDKIQFLIKYTQQASTESIQSTHEIISCRRKKNEKRFYSVRPMSWHPLQSNRSKLEYFLIQFQEIVSNINIVISTESPLSGAIFISFKSCVTVHSHFFHSISSFRLIFYFLFIAKMNQKF